MPSAEFEPAIPASQRLQNPMDIMTGYFLRRADINVVEITISASVDYQISVIEPADLSLYLPWGLERKIPNSNLASLIYFIIKIYRGWRGSFIKGSCQLLLLLILWLY
jgi:hypothetical protein